MVLRLELNAVVSVAEGSKLKFKLKKIKINYPAQRCKEDITWNAKVSCKEGGINLYIHLMDSTKCIIK